MPYGRAFLFKHEPVEFEPDDNPGHQKLKATNVQRLWRDTTASY
jgi:hypothetical protein